MRNQTRPQQQNLKQKETTTMKTKLAKMIMSCLAVACAAVCLAAGITLGTSSAARAAADERNCSGRTLHGLYVWTFDGYTRLGGVLVPKAVMQGLQFNEDGTTYNPFGTVNVGGSLIIDATGGVGTYTLAADCTGTISITDGPTFNIYVGPGAEQIWTTQTNVGTGDFTGLGVGTATRQPQ
jgi:hypothetical protein